MAGKAGRKVYDSREWRAARRAALARDGYRCSECGGRGGRGPGRALQVDHVLPVEKGGAPFDVANLRTVCPPCHHRLHAPVNRARRLRSDRRAWAERIDQLTRPDGDSPPAPAPARRPPRFA